ncbi:choice-of-anchor L domain-containing protein [Mesonia aquimarina]|uniref:choice-of-anchor L domain-containing protein n=1 Tax=Mesonia aquimarina TaxID=1504967 RepID=UPI0019694B9A|nr:choice-of-anchor L domain-containing protein [Mesonia aquimarina]
MLLNVNGLRAQNIYMGTGDIHYQCSGNFYDNGGENGYSEQDAIITLCPENSEQTIQVDFSDFQFLLAQGDFLKIYDGNSTNSALIGQYTTNQNPELILATIENTSGCLTFEFISDGQVSVLPGWEASISCQDCPTLEINTTISPSESIDDFYRVEKGIEINFETNIENAIHHWDFGDGFTASGQNVTHVYNPNPQEAQGGIFGTYYVKLIITTSTGCNYSLLYTIQVTNYRVIVNDTYTVEELIEDIFVTGECGNVSNIHSPSNGLNGEWSMNSLGFFERAFSDFNFEKGIVLTTGFVEYVPEGPNSGGGWEGDIDLDAIASPSYDATSIIFEFTPYISEISFEYIFTSYEYPQYVCSFADTFAFILSGPGIDDVNAYNHDANPNTPDVNLDLGGLNIALIPETNTPVSVTNIHHQTNCSVNSLGEFYTDVYYDYAADGNGTSGIDFYGQTVPLTATAQVIPGETYTIKLVVGDYGDRRYQSAVFLKGESFTLGPDLGEDIVSTNENIAIPCEGESIILNPFENVQTIAGLIYKWYKNGVLLENETEETLEITETGVYSVYAYYDENCAGTDEIIVEFLPKPSLKENLKIKACNDGPGENRFDLLSVKNNLLLEGNVENFYFSFYTTEEDAINNIEENEIQSPNDYPSEGDIIWIRVVNEEGCYSVTSIELILHERPSIAPTDIDEYFCLYTENGSTTIDLTQYDATINPESPTNTAVVYYADDNAYQHGDIIDNPSNYTTYSSSQTIIAEVININTLCESIEVATITIYTLEYPTVNINMYDGMVICIDSNPQTPVEGGNFESIFIDTALPNNGNYSFNWTLDGVPLVNDTPILEAVIAGVYEVEVIHLASGCISNSSARLIQSNPPEFIVAPFTSAFDEEHIIKVYNISGSGNYEFKVDNGPWISLDNQQSLWFKDITAGDHMVYGRDKNGCGVTKHNISFIDYPKFFTPNEDGVNDYWSLISIHNNSPSIKINQTYIFDRYGKLLTILSPRGSWDGTYNGKQMPSNDYWFRVEYTETLPNGSFQERVFKANFTLKR